MARVSNGSSLTRGPPARLPGPATWKARQRGTRQAIAGRDIADILSLARRLVGQMLLDPCGELLALLGGQHLQPVRDTRQHRALELIHGGLISIQNRPGSLEV